MDAFSPTTESKSSGDVSVLTPLIVSLAVGEAIIRNMDTFIGSAHKNRRHLMFGLFNGVRLFYLCRQNMEGRIWKVRFNIASQLVHLFNCAYWSSACMNACLNKSALIELTGFYTCFTFLSGTPQAGCQSDQDGNLWIVLNVESMETVKYYDTLCKEGGRLQLYRRFEIRRLEQVEVRAYFLVTASFRDSVELLKNSPIVRGVVITGRYSTEARALSEDASCPNDVPSAYKTSTPWNAKHSIHPDGFRFLDWNKPVFQLSNKSDIDIINENVTLYNSRKYHLILLQCYKKFNLPDPSTGDIKTPYCYAKLTQFILVAGDARTCIRRKTLFASFSQSSTNLCDPIEDQNVISVLLPIDNTQTDPVEVFILAARLDDYGFKR
uniref:Nicastrin n=1 Tax=Steinernema glaseri TaxID=37863 RepID=A0A1I7Y865_9BILA